MCSVGETQTPQDWQALARAVTDRRVELGHRTLRSFANASGLSTKTLGEIEGAKRKSYDRATLSVIESALRWPTGTVAAVLAGQPAPTTPPAPVPPPTSPYRTPVVVMELSSLLHPTSQLPDSAKRAVTDAVELVLERAHRLFVEGKVDAAILERFAAAMRDKPELPSAGTFLDALARDDSQLHPEDRQAIRDGMRVLLQLGQSAMLAYDAQQRGEREQLDELPGSPPAVKARDAVR